MAKAASKAVATVSRAGPPASLAKKAAAHKGKGTSQKAEDNLIPLIYILQAQSPQCLKRNPAYIEGAEAGMIWLKQSMDPLVNGDEGMEFQSCYWYKNLVEWVPRGTEGGGGGFVTIHEKMPADAVQKSDPKNPKKKYWERKNKNIVVETQYYVGNILGRGSPQPYVIPLASSGHSFGKALMTNLNQRQLDEGGIAPSWASVYTIVTRFRSNTQGDWFMYEIKDVRWATDKEFDQGTILSQAFETGAKAAEAPQTPPDDGGTDDDAGGKSGRRNNARM